MEKLSALLIVDDDVDVQRAARLALAQHAERVETVSSPEAMMSSLTPGVFDCVLLDMNFTLGERSGSAGMNALSHINSVDPELSVVLMTSYGAVSLAVNAIKHGASDFVLKPWRNDALVETVQAAAVQTRAARAKGSLALESLERTAIEKALARHEGNIAQAAAALGLSRPALYRRMAKHGL